MEKTAVCLTCNTVVKHRVVLFFFFFINSFLMCTNYDGYSIHAHNKRFISSHLCLYTWNKILPPLYFVSVSI